jgi:hypothetical protein
MQEAASPPPASPPWPVRLANGCAAGLRAMGLELLPFEPDALMRLARRRAGLDLEIDAPLEREGLERLCRSLEDDAGLSLIGRIGLREHVVGALATRLRLEHIRREQPERLRWQGPPPIVIGGLPRSGTTLLHRLLAALPDTRALALWELRYPLPMPGKDTRLAEVERQVGIMRSIAPVLDTKHPMGAHSPEECMFLLDPTMVSIGFWIFAPVYGHLAWMIDQDLSASYRCWADLLALMQAEQPQRRLVLKAPVHSGYFPALLAALPETSLVQTWRDPATVAVSMNSLFHSFHSVMSSDVDPVRMGQANLGLLQTLLRNHGRDRTTLGERVLDLQYRDLVEHPTLAVRQVWEHAGLDWDPAWQARLEAWLVEHPKDAAGRHVYQPETYGLGVEALEELRGLAPEGCLEADPADPSPGPG